MLHRRYKWLVLFFGLYVTSIPSFVIAESNQERTQKIYSAAIFYIAKFCHFTSPEKTPITICLLNTIDLDAMRNTFKDKQIGSRSTQVLGFNGELNKMPSNTVCDILYANTPNIAHSKVIELSKSTSVLVGSDEDFIDKGGFIQLGDKNNKLTIAINQSMIKGAGNLISSELLAISVLKNPS